MNLPACICERISLYHGYYFHGYIWPIKTMNRRFILLHWMPIKDIGSSLLEQSRELCKRSNEQKLTYFDKFVRVLLFREINYQII